MSPLDAYNSTKRPLLRESFVYLIDLTPLIALFLPFARNTPISDSAFIMTKPAYPVKFSPPEGFEAALAELESIVIEMEAGQMPLEESLEAHKRGMELLQYCQSKLQDAQQQVRLLEANTLKNFSPSGIDDR